MESNEELIARWEHVKKECARISKTLAKMQIGPRKIQKAKWAGCMEFALSQIESKMMERGLLN